MRTKINDFLKICVVLSCTFAVTWFGMLAAAKQAHGAEFIEEDLVKYTALAQEILFAGLSEIVPDEVLKKLIGEKGYKPL
ncbi:MAG: hypothetical protein Q8P07_05445 [bacterium]|nr:hypothetical protein [bacterium]